MTGCYYDNEEALYPDVQPGTLGDTIAVTFSGDILPMLQTYCWACHSNDNAVLKGNGIFIEDYSDVKGFADKGSLYGTISWDPRYERMPYRSAKLPSEEIFKVKRWIEGGAPEN